MTNHRIDDTGQLAVIKTFRFSALTVEELEAPRPHYRVDVHGSITSMPGSCDHTVGLLPEEVVMTVRLSTDVGTDLAVIKEAACQRALILLDRLVKEQNDAPPPASPAVRTNGADMDA